ncbi:hypothetical protein KP509_09G060900 [Ceratopteris richardii]|uniref:Uncharacterized protein n=1 Tax=Ceratopteris richardii TaxID=49495 RepID=A0A8T2U4P6_CERRI|nr:hypothetical protein KP509_09G060900 [Ceratopteris richardii]
MKGRRGATDEEEEEEEEESARVPPALRGSVIGLAAAAEKAFAAAEAAEDRERAACKAAMKAVEAYCRAATEVNMAECAKLEGIARSARIMTDTVTDSAAESSKEYMSHKVKASADPSVALNATHSALYSTRKSNEVGNLIKSKSFARPMSMKRTSITKDPEP